MTVWITLWKRVSPILVDVTGSSVIVSISGHMFAEIPTWRVRVSVCLISLLLRSVHVFQCWLSLTSFPFNVSLDFPFQSTPSLISFNASYPIQEKLEQFGKMTCFHQSPFSRSQWQPVITFPCQHRSFVRLINVKVPHSLSISISSIICWLARIASVHCTWSSNRTMICERFLGKKFSWTC
jgi:hypothetical protein